MSDIGVFLQVLAVQQIALSVVVVALSFSGLEPKRVFRLCLSRAFSIVVAAGLALLVAFDFSAKDQMPSAGLYPTILVMLLWPIAVGIRDIRSEPGLVNKRRALLSGVVFPTILNIAVPLDLGNMTRLTD